MRMCGAPGVRPGRGKRRTLRCQRCPGDAHRPGMRPTASLPVLESGRRMRVVTADAQGYPGRLRWGLNRAGDIRRPLAACQSAQKNDHDWERTGNDSSRYGGPSFHANTEAQR
jgi:hypothetical protein